MAFYGYREHIQKLTLDFGNFFSGLGQLLTDFHFDLVVHKNEYFQDISSNAEVDVAHRVEYMTTLAIHQGYMVAEVYFLIYIHNKITIIDI